MLLTKNAMLTKGMTEKKLEDLPVGGSAWTLPWAMYADKDGKLWLDGKFPAMKSAGGTVCMLVYRKEQGFVVNVSETRDDESWDGRRSLANVLPLQVIEVIGAKPEIEPNVAEATHYGRTYRFIVKEGKLAVMHGKKYIAHDIPFSLPAEVLDGPMGTALIASVEAGHKVGVNVGLQKAVRAVENAMVGSE